MCLHGAGLMRLHPRRPRTSRRNQMGRPLFKDVNGVKATRSYTTTQAGIKVQGYFTADGATLRTDYQIVKQRGAKTFVVLRTATDEFTEAESVSSISAADLRLGTLVSGTPSADGEIRILGSALGQTPGEIAVKKLTRRLAYDFSDNKYTWYVDNDSSGDVLVLTAI
jgi:hypothetical protein